MDNKPMTAPLHPAALNASNVIVDMSNTQQRSTEWHREYREKNPTARKRQSEASMRHYHRKKHAQQQSEAADGTSD